MPRKGAAKDPSDPRVGMAVKLLMRTRGLMVPEAMQAIGFTDKDADDCKKRTWVHRRVKKEDDDNNEHNNAEHNEEHNNEHNNEPDDEPNDDMSTVTMSVGSSSATSSVKHCAPASVQVRMTVSGKQQHRMIGKSIAEHKKKAHKRATTLYANELKKPSSKRRSSEVIAEEVREEYDGHGPCGRTIRTYVNSNGLVGTSPNSRGPKGSIPKWLFSILCSALDTYIQYQTNQRQRGRRDSQEVGRHH